MTREHGIEGQVQLNNILEELQEYNKVLELAVEWKSEDQPLDSEALDEYIETAREGYQQATSIVEDLDDSVENYTELTTADEYLAELSDYEFLEEEELE